MKGHKMIKGIVLAGGLATRLPNKALLPIKNGKPAITSSIDLLLRSGIKDITIVVSPVSAIPSILNVYYDSPFKFAIQLAAEGYINAIKSAAYDSQSRIVVTCCDNVYDEFEEVIKREGSYACVRELPAWQTIGLTKYDDTLDAFDKWFNVASSYTCFAGYVMFHHVNLIEAGSVVDNFNRLKMAAVSCSAKGWFDIGTLENYITYWRS